ncbi:MAG: hypothetical protein KatS3mg105_4265 [Gemmatales bacterium]|nr:MAG: hypothetical protein KatS3mg105_4265 [Gemmatales bacterium]
MIHQIAIPLHAFLREVVRSDTCGQQIVAEPAASSAEMAVEPAVDEGALAAAQLLENLADLASRLQHQQQQRLAEMQLATVELAVAIASELVQRSLDAGELGVEELVRQAIARFGSEPALTVWLHPEDLALLQRNGAERLLEERPGLQLFADPNLARGDLRAQTGDSALLSQLQNRLAEMRSNLLEGIGDAVTERRQNSSMLRPFPDRRQIA